MLLQVAVVCGCWCPQFRLQELSLCSPGLRSAEEPPISWPSVLLRWLLQYVSAHYPSPVSVFAASSVVFSLDVNCLWSGKPSTYLSIHLVDWWIDDSVLHPVMETFHYLHSLFICCRKMLCGVFLPMSDACFLDKWIQIALVYVCVGPGGCVAWCCVSSGTA